MAYGEFYVERQGWARWPRVLVICRKRGDGIERRRYVPERTCTVVYIKGVPRCSNCENVVYDEYKQENGGIKNYCDECGARVLEVDE